MIPFSPLIGGVTFIGKALFMMWARKQKDKHEQSMDNQALLASVDRSREQAALITSEHAEFARKTVVISMTMALVIAPVLAPLFGLSSAIGYHVVEPGFLWMADKTVMEWQTFGDPMVATMVVAPILYDLYAMVLGYYFGGKIK